MQAQSGSIVTPGLTSFRPTKLIIGNSEYAFPGPTQRRLRSFAAAHNVTLKHDLRHGSTWAGSTDSILGLAEHVLQLTEVLQQTFSESAAAGGLTLQEWMEDVDWAVHLDPSTGEGQLPWNIARVVDYAESIVLATLAGHWRTDDRIDPPAAVLDTLAMQDVVLMRPAKIIEFEMGLLMQNTHAFCRQWSKSHKNRGGGARHFAGLIACQASQQEVPHGEIRYAATVA
jgi:hypothetical protein